VPSELGYLMCMKSKYGPGGEFDPDWCVLLYPWLLDPIFICYRKPPTGPGGPGGPPADAPPPRGPPEEPSPAKPAWRTVTRRNSRGQKKKNAEQRELLNNLSESELSLPFYVEIHF
jgi:hypothetical protein